MLTSGLNLQGIVAEDWCIEDVNNDETFGKVFELLAQGIDRASSGR